MSKNPLDDFPPNTPPLPQRCFVVMGQTGEYSDDTRWCVAVYRDEKMAQTHVELATLRASELERWIGNDGEAFRYTDDPAKPSNEYDPGMQMYYTGTTYYVEGAPLMFAVPRPSNAD